MIARLIVGLLALGHGLLPGALAAETTLRWKFQPGEKLAVSLVQETKSEVTYGGKKSETDIDLTMHLSWEVLAAEPGKVQLKQTVTGLKIETTLGDGQQLAYDSTSKAKTTGRQRELADAASALIGAETQITMNERGEVLDAQTESESLAKAAAQGQADSQQPVAVKELIQKILRQPLAVLPEQPVAAGAKWVTENEIDTPLGKSKHTTTYTFVGPNEQEGRQLDRVEFSTTMQFGGRQAGSKMTIKEHKQSGHLQFDAMRGRLVSAEQVQTIVTERPYRETTIVVTLTSELTTTIKPAGETPAPR